MRLCFSAEDNLLAKAKENVKIGFGQLKRWWTKKYKLPANHELFVNQSEAELALEMFEDMLLRKQEILDELETADTKHSNELYQQLNALNVALGEAEVVQDDLVERWEKELEQGITPDLNAR
jgi:hypothetical protein